MSHFLFISIKPEFASKIIGGSKTIELRKNKPRAKVGEIVLIYSTTPVKAVIGFGKIAEVIESTPEMIWNCYSEKLGIDILRYDEYYSNAPKAIGIKITEVQTLKTPVTLKDIKKILPKFSPPQTYRYMSCVSALKIYLSVISA
jgi:predicted transcriptional regulator